MKNYTNFSSRFFRVYLIVPLLTLVLALPRFAHHTPDSKYYIALSQYFQGMVDRADIHPPYVYRLLLPFLASYGPTESIDFNFAIINLFCTIGSYFLFYFYLQSLLSTLAEANVGLLLLVVSFPTFNYASGVLTDPIGFFFFVAATYLLAQKRFYLFSFTVSLGVLAREALFVLILAFLIYVICRQVANNWDPRDFVWVFLLSLPSVFIYFAVRLSFYDLPSYFWYPSTQRFVDNMARPVSWATFLATLLPSLVLVIMGGYYKGYKLFFVLKHKFSCHEYCLLSSLTIACLCLIGYSILTAFMSGRFVWPLYVSLIPLAVVSSHKTVVYNKLLSPIAKFLFGDEG